MSPQRTAIAGIFATALVAGAAEAFAADASNGIKLLAELVPMLAALGFGFMWLHYDAVQFGFRRSASLNIGIVALALVFVPVYFIRARPKGQRLKPVLLFFVLVTAWTCLGVTTLTVVEYLTR